MHKLCRVKTTDKPIKVGSYLAKDGAWNRKYVVKSITHADWEVDKNYQYFILELQLLGSFYATGKVVLSTKSKPREIRAFGHKSDKHPRLHHHQHVVPA